ncbi:hypothetical protein [Marinobacter sp. 2_MG-2023]|uniref:hypothetical protein n=1 Tax=Marinobacter sp. 2_MG-2023 TaxID=3062679 RepID=UPI0026E2B707|nr:hypothetical protein [Marinobacter sp. 2_MG-2023]MDO6442562.1 hypothetical protein [Marinobacter sp. 2_MG-2023]
MPSKALVAVFAAASIVVGAGYLLSDENRFGLSWNTLPQGGEGHLETVGPGPVKGAFQPTDGRHKKPPSDNPVGFMLARVADQYAESVRYPPWSVPLTEAQAEGYQGNRYEPVTLPLENGGQFTVTLDKFRFTRGEDILVVASLQGPQVMGYSLKATLERPDSRDSVGSATLEQEAQTGYYQGSLGTDEEPGEYRLIVEALVDGKPVRHASSLTIEPYLGDFEGLEDTYLSNNNLVIPVTFSPQASGFYALSAQLYNGQQPVAQLQAERRLDRTADTVLLKAHGTVLANKSFSGAFQLRNLQIRQLPAQPGDRTHYAFGPDDGFSFEPPDLDALNDTPAVNPESEQRAALLKQLADKF